MKKLLEEKARLLNEMEVMNRSENPDQAYIQDRALQIATINGRIAAHEESLKDGGDGERTQERSQLGPQVVVEQTDIEKNAEYREAFSAYIRNSATHDQVKLLRAMNTGTDSKGGYTIPKDNGGKVFELEKDSSVMRRLGTAITLTHERDIPLQGTVPSAEYIAEGEAYPTGDAEFGAKNFKALKSGVIVPVSDELVDDEEFGLEEYLTRKINDSF
jgi:HK97 family phage major capsid protein